MSKNNGGPAFPRTMWTGSDKNNAHRDIAGMTLRDYLAAQAIIGFTSATNQEGEWTAKDCENTIAEQAYLIADAMLKERDK